MPAWRCSCMISLTRRVFTGSRPENGSSTTIRSGSWSRVAMSWAFCCMPLLSSWTFFWRWSYRSRRFSQPTSRRARLGLAQALEAWQGRPASVRRSGLCTGRAPRAGSRCGASWPRPACRQDTAILPPSGLKMSSIMRMVVVLPAPLGPSRPKISPAHTSNDTSLTTRTSAKLLLIADMLTVGMSRCMADFPFPRSSLGHHPAARIGRLASGAAGQSTSGIPGRPARYWKRIVRAGRLALRRRA